MPQNVTKRPMRLRRCQLAVPGSSDKMLAKAAALDVDYVFLDLEDAVAPNAKEAARGQIVDALKRLDWSGKTTCLRINDLETQYAYEDVIEVVSGAADALDVIMVPKVKSAADVRWVDILLSQIERKLGLESRIGIEVLIEEVEALMRVEEIAASTDRLEALIFGMGDYSASQGIDSAAIAGDPGYPGDIWHYARNKIVVAARAHGKDAVDGPFASFRDPDYYRLECERALKLGFVGKWAIHPSQIAIAQDVFSPSQDAVDRAYKGRDAYLQAQSEGLGAVQVDGAMVDVATVRILQTTIDRAEAIGIKPSWETA